MCFWMNICVYVLENYSDFVFCKVKGISTSGTLVQPLFCLEEQ